MRGRLIDESILVRGLSISEFYISDKQIIKTVLTPILITTVWILMPLSYEINHACHEASQSDILQEVYHAVYFFFGCEVTWKFFVAMSTPPRYIQILVGFCSSLVGLLPLHFLVYSGKLPSAVKIPINTIFSSWSVVLFQLYWIRSHKVPPSYYSALISPSPSASLSASPSPSLTSLSASFSSNVCRSTKVCDMRCFYLSVGLGLVITAFYNWCMLILTLLISNGEWISAVFLPIVFVSGLSTIKQIGKIVTKKLSQYISSDTSVDSNVDPNTPEYILELSYQHFYFLFYRQLFVNVNDPASMAVLQLNAMVMDLMSALSTLRFSVITQTEEKITFEIDKDRLKTQGELLTIRQLARFLSWIIVFGFSWILHYGYNKCFYNMTRDISDSQFNELMWNFGIMITWEIIFVFVLSYFVKKMLVLSLLDCAKRLFRNYWFLSLIIPFITHFITDVYFGLHEA